MTTDPSRVATLLGRGRSSSRARDLRRTEAGQEVQNGGREAAPGALDGGPAHRLLNEGRTLAHFGDTEVLVVRTRRGIFAVESRCPHLGRELADAVVSGRNVICTCVGQKRGYDLASGHSAGRSASRATRLRTFDVSLVDGRVWLSPKVPG